MESALGESIVCVWTKLLLIFSESALVVVKGRFSFPDKAEQIGNKSIKANIFFIIHKLYLIIIF